MLASDIDGSDADIALLLIDVINDLEFEGNEGLVESVPGLISATDLLRRAAREFNLPIIYINDNFNRWRSSFEQTLTYCTREGAAGAELARSLAPEKDDYFILKPMHSAFFCTPLELLLGELKIRKLILCGVAGNICVLFTANDAYMRGFELVVPCDAIASNTPQDNIFALEQMRKIHGADTRPAIEIVQELRHLYREPGQRLAARSK